MEAFLLAFLVLAPVALVTFGRRSGMERQSNAAIARSVAEVLQLEQQEGHEGELTFSGVVADGRVRVVALGGAVAETLFEACSDAARELRFNNDKWLHVPSGDVVIDHSLRVSGPEMLIHGALDQQTRERLVGLLGKDVVRWRGHKLLFEGEVSEEDLHSAVAVMAALGRTTSELEAALLERIEREPDNPMMGRWLRLMLDGGNVTPGRDSLAARCRASEWPYERIMAALWDKDMDALRKAFDASDELETEGHAAALEALAKQGDSLTAQDGDRAARILALDHRESRDAAVRLLHLCGRSDHIPLLRKVAAELVLDLRPPFEEAIEAIRARAAERGTSGQLALAEDTQSGALSTLEEVAEGALSEPS